MRDFRVEAVAQAEFEEAAAYYETKRDGLGLEFIAEVDRVLIRIAHEPTFRTAPIATVAGGVMRREFVERFPYVVVFVETDEQRNVIMIREAARIRHDGALVFDSARHAARREQQVDDQRTASPEGNRTVANVTFGTASSYPTTEGTVAATMVGI